MAELSAEIDAIRRLPYDLRGFRRFSRLLGLRIHPFQAFMLGFYFAGVIELVILISKKNGKTTLLAALALYHLLMTKDAECVIGASSRDQATILFNQAVRMLTDADLHKRRISDGSKEKYATYEGWFEVRPGYRLIRFEGGRIRVLAADADTADGIIPTLAIVDELHRHPSGALYGVFRDGLLGDAQMITISTAGASMDSPLGLLLSKAQEFSKEEVKRRRVYTSPDESFVLVEWALSPDDDYHSMKNVKSVNPAPWHTPVTLRRRHDSPSMTPGQWLRFACGIWTEGDEPAITGADWDPLKVDIGQIEEEEDVILVPSVGRNAAVAIAAQRPEGRIAVKVEILEADESVSMLVKTEQLILDLCKRYRVLEVHHPLGSFIRSAELLASQRVPMVEAPHSVTRLAAASGTFTRMLRAGLLMHDGDPMLRNHVLSATLKTNEAGERYEISDRSRGLIALVMAVHAASAGPKPKPNIFVWQGTG